MTFKLSITKDEINLLPRYIYEGNIVLIDTATEALSAIDILKHETVLGFDTETRASFKKGESYDISLLQLANKNY